MLTTRALLLAVMSVTTGSAAPQAQAPSPGAEAGAVEACNSGGGSSNGAVAKAPCSQAAGDFNISAYRLYPENADHDPRTCRTYFR